MKRVKIANGVKRIEGSDPNSTLFRLRDVLNEHRSILITRIVSDLPAYIDYKFKIRTSSRDLENVKESLYALRNSVIDLDKYNDITEHFFEHEMTYISSEPFLKEIDENIGSALNQSQLKIV